MQHIERIAGRRLVILVVRNQATAEVGGENLGRLKVLASEARLPAAGRADENHQRKLWNSDVHRLKTPICVGAPTRGSSSPTGRNRTAYPKRSDIRPDQC